MRLRLLEEQALLKHKEVVQLRGVVQRLRSRYVSLQFLADPNIR